MEFKFSLSFWLLPAFLLVLYPSCHGLDLSLPVTDWSTICNQSNTAPSSFQLSPSILPLNSECRLSGSISINCSMTPCGINIESGGYFSVNGLSTITISGVNFESAVLNSNPVFNLSLGASLTLQSISNISLSNQALASLNGRSTLSILNCPLISLGNNDDNLVDAIVVENSTLTILNSVFSSCRRRSSCLMTSTSNSIVTMKNSTWIGNELTPSGGAEVQILTSWNCSVLLDGCRFESNLILGSSDSIHQKMILINSGSFQLLNGDFSRNIIYRSPSLPSLGSSVSIHNCLGYVIYNTIFSLSTSPGCTYIHSSESSGSISSSSFTYATITGTPCSNASSPTHYPPFEKPCVSSVVCLTRNLTNLVNDFGSLFKLNSSSNPIWNNHNLTSNRFIGNIMNTTSPHLLRRMLSEPTPRYLLYSADIWCSNSKLTWGDTFGMASLNSIRIDSCLFIVNATLNLIDGLIDFGSSSDFFSLVSSSAVSIYGSAPFHTSSYQHKDFLVNPTSPSTSIVTGGKFGAYFTFYSAVTICCPYPEEILFSSPSPYPFLNELDWRNGASFSGPTLLLRSTTPVVGSIILFSLLTSAKLDSAAAYSPSTIIESTFISIATLSTSDLHLTSINLPSAPVVFLPISRSQGSSTGHGLASNGRVLCSNYTQLDISSSYEDWGVEWNPLFAPRVVGLSEDISIISTSDYVSGCTITTKQIPGKGTFSMASTSTTSISIRLTILDITSSFHPSGSAIIFKAPINFARFSEARGFGKDTCFGIFNITGQRNCFWASNSTLVLFGPLLEDEDGDLTLTPSSSSTFNIAGSNDIPSDYLPQLKPTVFIRTIEPLVGAPYFDLDASLSTSQAQLLGPSRRSQITWSCPNVTFGELNNFLDLNKHEWVLKVNSSLLTPSLEFHFVATISPSNWMPPSSREVISSLVKVTVAPLTEREETIFCSLPSFRIDSSTTFYLYEHNRGMFRVVFDPYCRGFESTNRFEWKLASEDGNSIPLSNNDRSWFSLNLNDPLHVVGSRFRLSVTVWNEMGRSRTSSINIVYKAYSPLVYALNSYEIDVSTQSEVAVSMRVEPSPSRGGREKHEISSFECPLPAYEVIPQTSFSDPILIDAWENMLCLHNTTSFQYDMKVVQASDSSPSSLILNTSPLWNSGDHGYGVNSTIEREDGSIFVIQSKIHSRPLSEGSFGGRCSGIVRDLGDIGGGIVIRFYNDSYDRQFPSQLIHNSESIGLFASMKNMTVCIGCEFEWSAIGGEWSKSIFVSTSPLNHSIVFLNTSSVGFGAVVYISVVVRFASGACSEGRIEFESGFYPFGGSLEVMKYVGDEDRVMLEFNSTGWSSIHPNLDFILVSSSECDGRTKLISFTSSPSSPSSLNSSSPNGILLPGHSCSGDSKLTIFAIDGVESVGESSAILSGGSRSLNENLTSFENVISRLEKQSSIGNINGIIDEMNSLEALVGSSSSYWSTNSPTIISTILKALKLIDGVELSDLITSSSFCHITLLEKIREGGGGVEEDQVFELLLKIGLSSPAPHMSSLNRIRFFQGVEMVMEGVFVVSFGFGTKDIVPTRESLNRFFKHDSVSSSSLEKLSKLTMPSSKTWIEHYNWQRTRMDGILCDIQVALTTGHCLISYRVDISSILILGPHSLTRNILGLPTNTIFFDDRSFPLLPSDARITPVALVAKVSTQIDINATFNTTFNRNLFSPGLDASYMSNIVCATLTGDSTIWEDRCAAPVIESDKVTCSCPFIGNSVSITILHRDAICTGFPPEGGKFYCENGITWVSIGTVTTPSLNLKGPVVVQGNLSTGIIVFDGLGGNVNVTDCAVLKSGIQIDLTKEEIEAIEHGGPTSLVLLTSGGAKCESGVSDIPISTNVKDDKCRRLIVTPGGSPQVLSITFRIEKLNCKTRWWIILLCVIGILIAAAIVVLLLFKYTQFKFIVRPFAKVKARRQKELAGTDKAANSTHEEDQVANSTLEEDQVANSNLGLSSDSFPI